MVALDFEIGRRAGLALHVMVHGKRGLADYLRLEEFCRANVKLLTEITENIPFCAFKIISMTEKNFSYIKQTTFRVD